MLYLNWRQDMIRWRSRGEVLAKQNVESGAYLCALHASARFARSERSRP